MKKTRSCVTSNKNNRINFPKVDVVIKFYDSMMFNIFNNSLNILCYLNRCYLMIFIPCYYLVSKKLEMYQNLPSSMCPPTQLKNNKCLPQQQHP